LNLRLSVDFLQKVAFQLHLAEEVEHDLDREDAVEPVLLALFGATRPRVANNIHQLVVKTANGFRRVKDTLLHARVHLSKLAGVEPFEETKTLDADRVDFAQEDAVTLLKTAARLQLKHALVRLVKVAVVAASLLNLGVRRRHIFAVDNRLLCGYESEQEEDDHQQ